MRDRHPNRKLQYAWNKYGEENFELKVILWCDKKNLILYEQRFIDGYDTCENGYNLRPKAESSLGRRQTEEEKKNHSIALKGKPKDKPVWNKGKHTGQIPWLKGKHHRPESNEKNRQAHLGKHPWSEQTRMKHAVSVDIRKLREKCFIESLQWEAFAL